MSDHFEGVQGKDIQAFIFLFFQKNARFTCLKSLITNIIFKARGDEK